MAVGGDALGWGRPRLNTAVKQRRGAAAESRVGLKRDDPMGKMRVWPSQRKGVSSSAVIHRALAEAVARTMDGERGCCQLSPSAAAAGLTGWRR